MKLWKHQKKTIKDSSFLPAYAIFHQQGTGKSKTLIETACLLYDAKLIEAVVVIAPNGVHIGWENQFDEHCKLPYISIIWHSQRRNTKKFQSWYTKVTKLKYPKLKVLSINIDAVNTLVGQKAITYFLKLNKSLLVVDESSRIKNFVKRTRNVLKFAKLAPFRRILSGTPLTRDILDLYYQYKFLNPSIIGISTFTGFRNRYAKVKWEKRFIKKDIHGKPVYREYPSIKYFRNEEELLKKIKPYTSRVLKKECLDLPEQIFKTIHVELTSEQRKYYRQMEQEMFVVFGVSNQNDFKDMIKRLMLDSADISQAKIKLTKMLRLRQITQGFITTDDKSVIPIKGKNPKLSLVLDELSSIREEKTIIWTPFSYDIDILIKEISVLLGSEAVAQFDGRVGTKEREVIKKNFLNDVNPYLIVAKPSVGGIGINEFKLTTNVYRYGVDYNAEHFWQAEERTNRGGSIEACTYQDIIAVDTIDKDILANIAAKKKIEEATINSLKD